MKLWGFRHKWYLGLKWQQQSHKASVSPFWPGAFHPLHRLQTLARSAIFSLVLQPLLFAFISEVCYQFPQLSQAPPSFSHLDSVNNMSTMVPSKSCHRGVLQDPLKVIQRTMESCPWFLIEAVHSAWGRYICRSCIRYWVFFLLRLTNPFQFFSNVPGPFFHLLKYLLSLPDQCLRIPSYLHCKSLLLSCDTVPTVCNSLSSAVMLLP